MLYGFAKQPLLATIDSDDPKVFTHDIGYRPKTRCTCVCFVLLFRNSQF